MKHPLFCFTIIFLVSSQCAAQLKEEKIKLPKELCEVSGLEMLNDSILIAINDSGNEPLIYFINLHGEIIKKTKVTNAVNKDWEDLTMDDAGNLYICDVGNNLNQRKDLSILKINANMAFATDTVQAEKIFFRYADQMDFAPDKNYRVFDCEAVYWRNDSLHILTKNTSKPAKNEWSNGSTEYVIPDIAGDYLARSRYHYWTGGDNRLKNQVTGVDIYGEEIYILTYGHLTTYKIVNGSKVYQDSLKFKRLTQKEAIVRSSKKEIYVAAEKNRLLGGPFLYKIEIK